MTGGADFSALTRRLSRADAVALTKDLPTGHPEPVSTPAGIGGRIVGVILTVLQWLGIALFLTGLGFAVFGFWQELVQSPRTMVPILILVSAVALAGLSFFALEQWTAPLLRAKRVLLAQENGWDFEPIAYPPRGALFAFGDERTVHDRIRLRRNPRVEIADYTVRVDSGKSSTTARYAYLAIALPQALPHIILDAVSTTGRHRSPLVLTAGFAPDQRLKLEGDFDQHFHLYAPKGYEQDALYLFTPDIMALFIDHAGAYDVEIIDGWLYLYGLPHTLTAPTVERWEATLALIDALDAKLDQWDRWRDGSKKARATKRDPFARPKPGVAEAGSRLRPMRVWTKLRRASVIVGAVFLILGLAAAVLVPWLGF